MNYQKILRRSIDLHVHIGPEIIPRKFDLQKLLNLEKGKLKGVGVKNHFFSTAITNQKRFGDKFPIVINSVVLNNYVGGFNPDVIRNCAEVSKNPIIVWFPTINARNFLKDQRFEIPKEWIDKKLRRKVKPNLSKNIKPLSVFGENGKISEEVINVLRAIKDCSAILATGHISWQESRALIRSAVKDFGIRKIIVTHPIYEKIGMPVRVQRELTKLGAIIEQCYSMYSIDKIPIKEIVCQIKKVGAENCILSSDVGQIFSKNPSDALADFMYLLENEGITEREIKEMLIYNPRKLIEKLNSAR